MFSAPSAYAADTHDYTETATSINGLEGTDKTGFKSDNRITLGTKGGPTNRPFSTYGIFSGGGKKNATEDVSNNTLTIHGLSVSNGGTWSTVYGGISSTGAVTNNHVIFNNGHSKSPIYGGYNGASATKAVTGNSVTVAGGTVEGDAFGGYTTGKGAVTGNSVTIKGGSLGDEAAGGVIGNSSSSANASGNTLTISGGAFTKSGGTNVFGAYNAGSGKTINNIVNLGDGENPMATGFNLTGVKIYGGNKTNDVTGNTLNVNASGIVVRTAQNFEKYNFNLTKGVTVGTDNASILNNTMLKLTEGSALGNTQVQWNNITLNAEKWNDDKTRYGKIGTVQMLWGGAGSSLKVYHNAAMDRTATSGDFEYHMYTDVSTPPFGFFGYNVLTYIRADIDRFQNADATADNVTGTAVYGGYSSLGNTTTKNKIKITNTNNTNLNVYGGYTAGAGDSTKNTVTIAGASKVKNVYGGYVTAANAKADGNTVNIESGSTVSGHIYGGYANGSGTATNNTVNLGDADHTDFAGTTLTNSEIHGGNKSNVTGNTLNVNAKNVTAKSVNNFENYKFKLNSTTTFGDTMLTVTNAGDFAGTGVDMNKITVDRTGLTTDYLATQHGIKRMTLMKRSNTADTLKFRNYAAKKAADATETHEFRFVTNSGTGTANALMLEASRFKGSRVTYDGSTASYNGEIYGGISREGHTTTDNQLTVTAIHGTDDPKYAFGGLNEGTTGDVTNSHATVNLQNAADEIAEVYGGMLSNADNAGEVSGNSVTMQKGTVQKVFGGYTAGTGTVKNNTVNFSGSESADHIAGAYVENVANASEVTGNKVVFTGGTADNINGAVSEGTGALKTNTIAFSGTGSMANALRGAFSKTQGLVEANGVTISGGTVDSAFGAVTAGTGIATKNYVTVSGGTVNTEIAGGVGYNVTANTVTISGGTVSGDVYGGKSAGPGSSTSGNIVNLGAEDGTYTANLTNAALHGDNNSGTGATLNVRAKNITAKSADKFANYTFHLNDDIAQNGGSMLTLTENNGFNGGNLFDWTKLDVDTSKLSGNTVIGNATLLTGTTNGLKFSNYAGKDRTHGVVNGDYETALRTDTNTGTATKVILDYNRFQNNTNATYDGSVPATTLSNSTTEIYGGISYAGNTTKNNHLTVTGVQGNLTSAYGGKTGGAKGDAVKNRVTVKQTNRGGNAGAISNVFGGYTSSTEATAKAEDNTVTIEDGTVGAVYGGYAENAASAMGNHVFIQGGTVQNAVVGGGGKNTATGNMSGNDITITGGTVSGMIIGGDSRVLTSTSNKNIINLGDDTGAYAAHLSSAQIWGTSYGGNVLANDNAKIAGNTLNVKAKNGAEVAKVRNVQKFSFQLHDDTTKTAPLLNMTDADGFGKVSADNSDVKVAWANVTVDLSKVTTAADAAKIQGKNTYTLMRGANNKLKFSDYAARYGTYAGVYETGLRTDATANSGTVTATNVLYDINRFKDGRVTYTAASTGEALGGYSAFGNTTTGNQLTVSGVTGTLAAAYGGQTAGATGNSVNNKVTVAGTGTGSVTNVYGGAITNAANGGNVTGNTVTLTGGKVTGKIYGGYTAGNGETTGNTVNLGADPTTLRQGDASTLATGTNFTAAELYGGSKSDDVTGNTLNVTVKDAAAKKVQNFDKYTFYLTNSVAADKPSSGMVDDTYTTSRGTMLTLANGFDGQTANWNKVTVDTSKLSADKTLGAITLMKSTAANKLKFSNYAAKNHAVSGDYEVVQRTDTNTGEANAVLIDVNRFKNGDVIYDGVNPNAKTYAGVSYGGNTAEKNIMTLTGIASGNTVDYLSGGRSEGTAGGAVNNTVNLLGTGAGTLKSVYGGYIGKATNAADATGNTVNIAGGTAQNVYGGYTNGTGKTTGNIVNIGYTDKNGTFHAVADGTKVTGTIYGGSQSDHVTGNTLNVRGAITAGQIANFEKLNFAVNKDTAGKTRLSINGTAATTGLDWSKVTATVDPTNMTVSSYGASRITLMANANGIDFGATYHGAKGETRDVFEFVTDKDNNSVYTDTYRFKGNEVSYAASDNTHDSAWGGRSELGNVVEENTLTMTGGEITGTAYGGTSRTNTAKKNRLVLHGGSAGELVGGFGKTATDNTVDIFGGTVRGDVYGGHATNGAASNNTVNLYHGVTIGGVIHGGAGNTDSTNNTLAVRSFGTTVKDFDGVQNLHFYLPAGTTSSETRTMLTLTNAPAVKDISTLNLGVAAVAADTRALRPGDAVSLLKTNGTLTTAAQLRNTGDAQTMKATQSGILDYTMRLEKRGENELIATVDRVDVNDRSKSPVETRVAASALLNAGADLLSNVGYTAATEAAAVISAGTAPASSSAEGTRNTDAGLVAAGTAASAGANATAAVSGAFQPWAAQGGSSVRLNSGSYVDAKGWNLNVGFARTNEMKDAKLTYGPFVEYGRGTYDSYLDDGTHGSGAMHYVGGGVMAKMSQNSGLYVEGSLRAGRVSSDYTGSDDAAELSYDNASTYFAGHVGVGQEWKLAGGDKIEGYAKYFYSHQAGNTTKLRSGGTLEFGDVDSHRLRVGARYTHAVGGGSELYAGLAYEHEFGGDAAATYQGYSTPSPSLGGGTGILELGYRFAPKDGRVSYGVNLMGMTGQREGIAGGAQVTWAF